MFEIFRIRAIAGMAMTIAVLFGAGEPAAAQSPGTVIRVNAGGGAYTDSAGHVWSADAGYNSGSTFALSGAITGTADPALYASGRFDPSSGSPNLEYSFAVPGGVYDVRLHFADGFGPGARQFSVKLEGTTVFANLDVGAEAGVLTALVKSATVQVTDGNLNIEFLFGASGNTPIINAIEILGTDAPTTPLGLSPVAKSPTQVNLSWQPSTDNGPVAAYAVERCSGASCKNFAQVGLVSSASYVDSGLTPPQTYRYRVRAFDNEGNASPFSEISATTLAVNESFTPIRVNAGGGSYTDTAGHVWSADAGYNTGSTFSPGGAISGTSDPALYADGRFDPSTSPPNLQYSFVVPSGMYDVRLHFADGFGAGARQFSVKLEGATVFANLDVGAEVGALAALVKSATAQVTDGHLDIEFLFGASTNTPIINAIEIGQVSAADVEAPSVPGALSAVAASSSRIDLSWGAAGDNVATTGYRVERCRGIACSNFAEVATATGTTFSDTTLSFAATYRYRVRAVDSSSNYSGYSSIASAATYLGSDMQSPTAPAALGASAASGSQIELNWSESTDNVGVVGYRLERCQGAGCSNFAQIAALTSTSYMDGSLVAGVLYRYRVRAVDAIPNFSAYSSIVSATTLSGGGDSESPSAPAPLSTSVFSANRIDLSWGASTDNVGVVGYFIERCPGAACSTFTQIAALGALTMYPDSSLVGGTTYRYRVRATDAQGNLGAYSAIVTATTAPGTGRSGSTTYQYDSFGRLKQVTVTPQ